ncbi:cytochrome P450 704C1-like [Cocos nucifera]|uniref:Cytochrome P450 704C1-like n=1 Tax=Cocos nucifera TaxID=13894 RepID=A0A8K0N6V5_COCNU|nr:cytochrome P450 704C1-like [Cocos nucifera]
MDFLSFRYSITLIATAIACLCLHTFIKAATKRRHPPVTGSIFHQLYYFSTVHDYHTDLAARFKTFRLFAPTHSLIYTVDPAVVEYILRTNYANYGKGSYNHENLKDFLGDGIFAVDGEKWRHQRKLASYEFSTKNLRDFSSDVFRSNAARLSLIISKAANSNQAMDIQDLFMRSTLDSIFKVGFGDDLDTLSGLSEEGNSFAKAFDDSSDLILWRYVDIFWKIKRFLGIGSEAELKKNIRVIDGFAYKLIHRKTQSMSEQQNDTMKKEDILSRFLAEKKKDPKNLNDKYLRDIILNFITAGRDTTAVTLSWFFYMLCKHPSLQEKLAREIKEATKANDSISIAEFTSMLTEEALEKMQYLHAALTETLRIYPAVPEDPKICFSDDTLPGGFDVKKGDMVCFLPYSMGRMKFLWGVDAGVFRPERWLDENGVFQPENPFKFTAFQACSSLT